MLLTVRIPPGSERGPQYMAQALAAMHDALQWRDPLTLVIGHFGPHVGIGIECSPRLKHVAQEQLSAQYPECEISPAPSLRTALCQNRTSTDQVDRCLSHRVAVWSMSARLSPDVFPLKTYRGFEDLLNRTTADPLASLLAATGGEEDSPFDASIDVQVRPARRRIVLRARRIVGELPRAAFEESPRGDSAGCWHC